LKQPGNRRYHWPPAGFVKLFIPEMSKVKYSILKYGRPELRKKARRVGTVTPEIRKLAEEMLRAMRAANGLGLAAQQIGRTENMCVIDIPPGAEEARGGNADALPEMPLILINPEIVHEEGVQVGQEGCLSFPEIYVNVRRAERVRVRHMDLQGTERETEGTGLLARAIQHELDHLRGVLLCDRMTLAQKVSVAGRLKRLRRESALDDGSARIR